MGMMGSGYYTTKAMRSPAHVVESAANKGSESKIIVLPIFSPSFGISLAEITAATPVEILESKEMAFTRAEGLVL